MLFLTNYSDDALIAFLELLDSRPYENREKIKQVKAEINFRAKSPVFNQYGYRIADIERLTGASQ